MTPNFIIIFPQEASSCDVMEELTEITLHQLCKACGAPVNFIIGLVNYGVMDPISPQPDQGSEHWRFTGNDLRQAQKAMRLQRDLGVNLAGAALALQLIDEIDFLQIHISRIERR